MGSPRVRPFAVDGPIWFAAAVVNIGVGLTCLAVWIARPHFGDGQVLLDAGARLEAGAPIYQGEMLYPPLAAALGLVLRHIPDWFGIESAVRISVFGAVAWIASQVRGPTVTVLAVIVAVTCIPFVEDLVEANEMTWVALAVVVVAWRRDELRTGIALGVVCALFAKPQLLPFLLWMLVWRPRALVGVLATAAGASLLGAVLTGTQSYISWVRYVVSQVGVVSAPFPGNQGLGIIVGGWLPVVDALLVAAFLLVLWRLDDQTALVWAVSTGVLILPYASGLYLLPLVAAWRRLGRIGPLGGLVASPLALFAPAAMLLALLAAQLPTARGRPRGRATCSSPQPPLDSG
jgi:hypothetical protein